MLHALKFNHYLPGDKHFVFDTISLYRGFFGSAILK